MKPNGLSIISLVILTFSTGAAAVELPAIQTEARYPTVEMGKQFVGENEHGSPKHPGFAVHYLSDQERDQYRVVVYKGEFYRPDGTPLEPPKFSDRWNYVMDADGNFYFF